MLDTTLAQRQRQNEALATFGPYLLPILEDVHVVIDTDLGVLAPEFQQLDRKDTLLLAYMSTGCGPCGLVFRDVVHKAGWGHAAPYLYAAVYHSLGRILYGISVDFMRLPDGTPLLPRERIAHDTLRIRVFAGRERYNAAAGDAIHRGASGYWNPQRKEIGIFVDKALFRWAGYQAKWQRNEATSHVSQLENYVKRLVIRKIGHELFHAVQQHTPADLYYFPFVAEGTAIYAQENGFDREELFHLSPASVKPVAECSLTAVGGRLGYSGLKNLYRAEELVRSDRHVSVTHLLSLDEYEFYDVLPSELEDRYALALGLIFFLNGADSAIVEAWKRITTEILQTGGVRDRSGAASRFDSAYVTWLRKLASRWWGAPDARDRFVKAREHSTACLNARWLGPAYMWARQMAWLQPTSPTGPIYIGDIFFRIMHSFTAFDYYAIADALLSANQKSESQVKVKSRLADALEQLGDIEGALTLYKKLFDQPITEGWEVIILLRSRLKYEYYEETRWAGRWRTEASQVRLNNYVRELASWPYASAVTVDEMLSAIGPSYNEVLERMRSDLKSHQP
jgi:hypothetical protein